MEVRDIVQETGIKTIPMEKKCKKDVLFIIGDWNATVGSPETPGVTGKFGLEIRNEAGKRLKTKRLKSFAKRTHLS